MQRVVRNGTPRLVGKVWQRNSHRRENCTGEGHAFQDARGSFEIALRIATRTAGHVGSIGGHYLGGRWRNDGFRRSREHGNSNGDQSD